MGFNQFFFISGDWLFWHREQIQKMSWWPTVFDGAREFGGNIAYRLWIDYPLQLFLKLTETLRISWFVADKLLLGIIFVLAGLGGFRLGKRFFPRSPVRFLVPVLYIGNTYFFLIVGGGQLGVALALSFVPWVIDAYFSSLERMDFWKAVSFGVICSILLAFDLRVFYLTGVALIILSFFHFQQCKKVVWYFGLSAIVLVGLHMYWILPVLLTHGGGVPPELTQGNALAFFSVADFSHALSLLHPNWPENLFGRVYFQQPEFLLLPILAFGALLWNGKKDIPSQKNIVGFAALGLFGAFLAKGVNPPFGEVYDLLFRVVPGFSMFRDPTKFYMLTALSYSILIPYTIEGIAAYVNARFHYPLKKILLFAVLCFVAIDMLLLRAVYEGKTTHSFVFSPLPTDYVSLKNMINADPNFSRVLWLPTLATFVSFDTLHPVVDAETALRVSSPSAIARQFADPLTIEEMGRKGIGYIVVPVDIDKRIFLNDYRYDDTLRQTIIHALDDTSLLKFSTFHDLAVYRLPMNHGLIESSGVPLRWQSVDENTFRIEVPSHARDIVLLYPYDSLWRLHMGSVTVVPTKSSDGWTSFTLPSRKENTQMILEYRGNQYAKIGTAISFILVGSIVGYFGFVRRKKHV
jgi:hypothetical protein